MSMLARTLVCYTRNINNGKVVQLVWEVNRVGIGGECGVGGNVEKKFAGKREKCGII